MNQLPTVHAVAIRLRDNGFDDRAIAAAVGIDEHEVAMLLQVAERKLTNLMDLEQQHLSLSYRKRRSKRVDRGPTSNESGESND